MMDAKITYVGRDVQGSRKASRDRLFAQSVKPAGNSVLRLILAAILAVFFYSSASSAASATATVGQAVTLSVAATGTAPFSYQWLKNGASISGATAATYSIAAVASANAGDYSVNVSNSAGSTTSDIATLVVAPALVVPSITSQPAALTVTAGQAATFTVAATGSGTLTYQWSKNGAALSGATAASYKIAAATSTDAGNYSVVVTNSVGYAASVAALLTVNAPPASPPTSPVVSAAFADASFETTSVGSNAYMAFKYNPSSSAWTFTGNAGITGNGSGFTSGNPGAPNGTQVAFIQMGGSIAQDLVLSAGTYSISAQVANRANSGGQQTVLVYVDAQLVGTFKGTATYTAAVTNTFTLTAGTHSVDFVGLATTDSTLFLDQVTLVSAPVSISNSGFESPSIGSGSYMSFQYNPATVTGVQDWTFTGNAGVAGNNSGFTSGNPTAPEGTQVAFLQSTGSAISQSVYFPSDGVYVLALSAAQRGNWNMAPQRANVYLDGALLGTFTPSGASYEAVSVTLPTTQGTHVLSIKGVVSNDCTLFIDRVSILPQ